MPSSLKLIRRGNRKQSATLCLSFRLDQRKQTRENTGKSRSPHPNTSTRVGCYKAPPCDVGHEGARARRLLKGRVVFKF